MIAAEQLLAMDKDRMGRFGEAICENVMRSSGITYIPLCKLEMGGAPMAIGNGCKTVLPDFDVSCGQVLAYLDAKVKTQSVRFRNAGEVRHGIDRSKYDSYVAAGLMQRKQCGLFVVELLNESEQWSGSLMSQSFAGLGKPIAGFSNQSHMIYWPRSRFAQIGSFSPDELLAIARGRKAVNMKALLSTEFAAPPPRCTGSQHALPENLIDDPPDHRGMIRTTCKICGAWMGSRPAHNI